MADAIFVCMEVLAGLYLLLGLAAVLALVGPWHAKTTTIRVFCVALVINSLCRAVYFAVPAEAWGGGVKPSEVERFSSTYWKLFVQFAFYVVADFTAELEYIQILSLWHQAQCILTDRYPCLPPLMFRSTRILLGLWSAALLGMYIAMPFPEVLLVASAIKLAICVVIFSAFMYYLATLRNIMKTAAMHPNCWAMCLYPKRNDALLNDMKEYNTWRARHKLARITRVCVLYAVCAVFRAVVMCYQLDEALTGFKRGASQGTWFGIVFSNYLVTEILVAALVLLIVRKPARAKRGQGYTVIEGES